MEESIKQIIQKNYNLQVLSLVKLKGFYDSNYRLLTNKGKRFLKIYGKDNLPSVKFQVELTSFLKSHGFPVADTIYAKNGKVYVLVGSNYAVMQEWLRGKGFYDSGAPVELMRKIGFIMAKMHLATQNAVFSKAQWKKYVWDAVQFNLVTKDFIKVKPKLSNSNIKAAKEVFGEWGRAKKILSTLPKGVCHNDFHGGNLFVQDNKLSGIVDFGDALKTWYAADLAIALFFICYSNANPTRLCKSFVSGYQKIRKLTVNEKKSLVLLIKMRAVALLVEVPLEVKHKDNGFYEKIFKQAATVLKQFSKDYTEKFNREVLGLVGE